MQTDGVGWLWAPTGLKDGPLPTHYEPLESPVRNDLYRQQSNPGADRRDRPDNPWADSPDARFPHVLTTYRLTEHHTAGGDVADAVASRRAAAGALLRDLARAGRGRRRRERRHGDDLDGPRIAFARVRW